MIHGYPFLHTHPSSPPPLRTAALKHIDYPTLILGKSCKLVPVMLMSFLLHRKTFPWYKYASVVLITIGVSCFMLLHSQETLPPSSGSSSNGGGRTTPSSNKSNSLWGLLLLGINLLVDGATNSSQDHIFRTRPINGPQMMFFMNGFSTLLMIIWMVVVGPLVSMVTSAGGVVTGTTTELWEGLVFCQRYGGARADILLFGVCGALGQVFIFYTLERFGSLLLVTINVTRKMISMLLSVVWFRHVLSLGQWSSVATVFAGIALDAYMARRQQLLQLSSSTSKKTTTTMMRKKKKDDDYNEDDHAEDQEVLMVKRPASASRNKKMMIRDQGSSPSPGDDDGLPGLRRSPRRRRRRRSSSSNSSGYNNSG